MSRQVPTFTSPALTEAKDPDVIKNGFNTLGGYANDHDAMHWHTKMSAPKLGAGGVSAAVASTGGTMTSSETKYGRFTFVTPNGESVRSSEQSVVLGGSDNAIQYTIAQVDAQFTPTLYVYQALAGAASGQPTYRCRQADLSMVSGGTVNADGSITLNTAGTTVFKVIAHPPNTEPVAPTTNSTGSVDPLSLLQVIPMPATVGVVDATPDANHYTVTETYTTPLNTMQVIGVYDKTLSPVRLSTTYGLEIRASGAAIARFLPTFSTHPVTGAPYMSALAQQEA